MAVTYEKFTTVCTVDYFVIFLCVPGFPDFSFRRSKECLGIKERMVAGLEMWDGRRAHRRSLGFARDDKQERVVVGREQLPRRDVATRAVDSHHCRANKKSQALRRTASWRVKTSG